MRPAWLNPDGSADMEVPIWARNKNLRFVAGGPTVSDADSTDSTRQAWLAAGSAGYGAYGATLTELESAQLRLDLRTSGGAGLEERYPSLADLKLQDLLAAGRAGLGTPASADTPDGYATYLRLRDGQLGKGWIADDLPAAPVNLAVFASRGGSYSPNQVVDWSHYYDPISHPPTRDMYALSVLSGEPAGNSRDYGDASRYTQQRAMDAIVFYGRQANMTDREIALTLAIARCESGFNPDAAAGTTSAAGLGQMVDKTATQYGINDLNRWNMDAQAFALVQHTRDNMALAANAGHGGGDLERYTYAYHHDGPTLAYGGLQIADAHVVPNVSVYLQYVPTH